MSNQVFAFPEMQDKSFFENIQRLCKVKNIESFVSQIKCGDVLKELKKINEKYKFDVIIIDPPYNIGKDFGNNKDLMELQDYIKWSKKWLDLIK